MTAINAILKRDRAIMMTDAALYSPSGDIIGFGQKAFAIPSLKAAIAVRGAQKVAALLAMEMAMVYKSFDHLLADAEDDLRKFCDASFMHLSDLGMSDIDIVVVGWSDAANCAKGCSYNTVTDEFELIDGWEISPFPADERENLRAVGAVAELHWTESTFDPIRHGIPYMEAQRRLLCDVNGRLTRIVGGHILLTEITREGVFQRVIHHWDDEIGQPISPAAFVPPSPSTMSRQQRRAMERQQRKSNVN